MQLEDLRRAEGAGEFAPAKLGFCAMGKVAADGDLLVTGFSIVSIDKGHLTMENGTSTALSVPAQSSDFADVKAVLLERDGPPMQRDSEAPSRTLLAQLYPAGG